MHKNNKNIADKIFNLGLNSSIIFISLIIVGIFITLIIYSLPSISHIGFEFLTGTTWDPVLDKFGALPFLIGTITTSFLALLISFPVSINVAILISEYIPNGALHNYFKSSIELLAGIPSIIYGFWGLFILIPVIREFQIMFDIPPYGVGIFTSSIILALMIIPYSATIIYEIISLTPNDLKEAAYSLGATKFEVIKKIIIPNSMSGILAGILLSLGRALGETMAVTMVIGNSNSLPESIFAPGNTMASLIANEFTEATSEVYLSALIEIGLLLMIVTGVINIIGKFIIKKLNVNA